ncbi:transposase family protein [Pontibacter qinzhouensis]|uniref:transposase family protein n=1 Tax=Pontibacter qinzhouensis TaxID=2603253 RepID=UPI00164FC05A|nr:transposase family protein [Pontibacter qinzhouensis]
MTVSEFFDLLEEFDSLWQQYHPHYDLKGKRRVLEKFSEHGSMSLKGSTDKLFFVLYYLKHNPLQSGMALTFQMSQGKVSQWLKVLLPLLCKALQRLQMLPVREPGGLYMTLRLLAGQVVYMDATERPVPRSVNWERQKHEYSGKKGCHTNKNLLVSDEHNRVLYLSPTVEGSLHDKALADEMELEFVPEKGLLLDLGFVGYKPEGAQLCLPVKKMPNQPLSEYDKLYNSLLASIRVKVEHVMAGVKRVRTVKDKMRLHGDQIRDKVMLIACGLQNIRVTYRNLS